MLQDEQLYSFLQIARADWLPRRSNGRTPHFQTFMRWAKVGIFGVRLESVRVGMTLCTSREAIQRFFDRVSEVMDGRSCMFLNRMCALRELAGEGGAGGAITRRFDVGRMMVEV